MSRLKVSWQQEWLEWFSNNYNWKNFTVIHLGYERLHYKEKWRNELMLGLFGLHVALEW